MSNAELVNHMIENTNMTMGQIATALGITWSLVKDLASMSETDLVARDTRIEVYDVVGHDATDMHNVCVRCGIILLHPWSGVPAGWGEHQEAIGNVCRACLEYLVDLYERELRLIHRKGCVYCDSKLVDVYFYQPSVPGNGECYARAAVPLCDSHKEKIYAENRKSRADVVRSFHRLLPVTDLNVILSSDPIGRSRMPTGSVLLEST